VSAASQNDFDRSLESGSLLPVYALFGSEHLLVTEAVAALRDKAVTRAPDFNRQDFDAGSTPIERVLEAAATMPMMAPRRYVHLRDAHQLKADSHPPLLAYLENPADHTVLCLSGEKIDQRTKLGMKLSKSGYLFLFEAPRQQELAAFVESRARRRGYRIALDAAQLLADLVGGDVGTLDRSLEKLSLYLGGEGEIDATAVEEVVAPTRVHRIFELTDAVGARDFGKASLLLRNALGGGDSTPLGVLGMITRQFRQLLQVKAAQARGVPQRELAAVAGVPPFAVSGLVNQARRYEQQELILALEAALRADIRLKSQGVAPGVVLDRLLVEVIERRSA
jgi:DNA polymerase-3 subunit delta